MPNNSYRFTFNSQHDLEKAEMALLLAVYATEGLFGRAKVKLEAAYSSDSDKLNITIGSDCELGRCLAEIFTGFLERELGEDQFEVSCPRQPSAEVVV